MSKNIVVFSDGTGQDGGKGSDSNVYKLFKAVENRTPKQIAFYDRGLGTDRRWLSGKISGAGISRNIIECYRFIFDNYETKDQIYLFGFSRGAATVRSLSGFINLFGILPKSRPELIEIAYEIYKIRSAEKREKLAKEFCERHHTMWAKVKFLGVWDTVPALGAPLKSLSNFLDVIPIFKHKFHDFSLSKCVENAFHALAIDDERKSFHPKLWDVETEPSQSMKQVWFSGMHTDVGGGYENGTLSRISLKWMVDNATSCQLRIWDENFLDLPKCETELVAVANSLMNNSRGSFWTNLYTKKIREWPMCDAQGVARGKPDIHESVSLRTKNCDNNAEPPYKPWIQQ